MEQTSTFVGIDISKLTLDICIVQGKAKQYFGIENEPAIIRKFFLKVKNEYPDVLCIGMENTGCYNNHLYVTFSEMNLSYYVIPPLHLKKSLGLSRGKNDKVDALRIATFLEVNLKNLQVYKPQRSVVKKLQLLLTLRDQRVKVKKAICNNSEYYSYDLEQDVDALKQMDIELVCQIEKQIKEIECQIQELVKADEKLSGVYKLISSVPGVGKVLGWHLLVRTGEFERIDSARKLACYAGVAPFEHRSGTSIRGRSKVSPYADKILKKLLHMATLSVIRFEGELRDYYCRKVEEGKNKMLVLNALRNKIIHRIYAVLKHQRPYEKYPNKSLVVS